jgi:hypothetical protein
MRCKPVRYMPMRCLPIRYTPMRHMPVKYTPIRCMLMKCIPMRCTPVRYAHKTHAYKMHAHDVTPIRCAPVRYTPMRHPPTIALVALWPTQWSLYRDLSFKIRVFALRDKRCLFPSVPSVGVVPIARGTSAQRVRRITTPTPPIYYEPVKYAAGVEQAKHRRSTGEAPTERILRASPSSASLRVSRGGCYDYQEGVRRISVPLDHVPYAVQ